MPDLTEAPDYTEFAAGLARWAIAQMRTGPQSQSTRWPAC
jgi:hypothetical protein